MDADDFRDYMLSFLFLRYLSDNYETAAKKELGRDYPTESEVAVEIEAAAVIRLNEVAAKKAKRKSSEEGTDDAGEEPLPIVTSLQL